MIALAKVFGVAVYLAAWLWSGVAVAQSAQMSSSALRAARPYEAPSFSASSSSGLSRLLPALPPEYLRHRQSGALFAYHPSAREQVRLLIAKMQPLRRQLQRILGADYLPKLVRVRLAVSQADMLRVVPANAPPSDLLVLSNANLIVLRSQRVADGAKYDTQTLFRRGLALMVLDKIARDHSVPLWFRLGFASRFARGLTLSQSRSLWWASMRGKLLPLSSLDSRLTGPSDNDSLAHVQAQALVAHLERPAEQGHFLQLIRLLKNKVDFAEALRGSFQMTALELDADWRRRFARHRSFVPVLAVSLGLWLALMATSWLRRRRRQDLAAETLAVPIVGEAAPEPVDAESEDDLEEMIRQGGYLQFDSEVPKVVHGGDWHTLH